MCHNRLKVENLLNVWLNLCTIVYYLIIALESIINLYFCKNTKNPASPIKYFKSKYLKFYEKLKFICF